MKKLLVMLCSLVLLGGCSIIHIEKIPDGKCTAEYISLFKSSDAISGSACGADANSKNSGADKILKDVLIGIINR